MNEELFANITQLMNRYGLYEDRDVFKVLLEYQATRLNKLETAIKDKQRRALHRTVMYHEIDILFKWNKMSDKTKGQKLYVVVNLMCMQYTGYTDDIHKGYYQDIMSYIVENKDKILGDSEWYLQTIPESHWLINHLKSLKEGTENAS